MRFLLAALMLAACAPKQPPPAPIPTVMSEANCDFDIGDMEAAAEINALPRTPCQSDADCMLIASVCGWPDAAHTKDAACLERINSSTAMVVDCAPFESTQTYLPRCEANLCLAQPDPAQP